MPAFGYYGCKDIASRVRDSEISPVQILVCFNCESSKRSPYIEGIDAKKKLFAKGRQSEDTISSS